MQRFNVYLQVEPLLAGLLFRQPAKVLCCAVIAHVEALLVKLKALFEITPAQVPEICGSNP